MRKRSVPAQPRNPPHRPGSPGSGAAPSPSPCLAAGAFSFPPAGGVFGGPAEEEYRKALEVRPGDPEATNNLAWAAIFSGERREEAAARMEAVLSRPGNRTATLLDTLGVLRMRLGRAATAEEAFVEAERLCLEAGEPGCPGEILREIRDHRAELDGRIPSSPAPPLVQ